MASRDDPSGVDRLRLRIEGAWLARDFSDVFRELQFLYEVCCLAAVDRDVEALNRLRESLSGMDIINHLFQRLSVRSRVRSAAKRIEIGPRDVTVAKINYASPGVCDLVGIARAVREMRILITDMVDRYLHRENRALKRSALHQDVMAKRIRNAGAAYKLAKKIGMDHHATEVLLQQILRSDDVIGKRISEGKITHIE
jgi:hypothetical protein